MTRGFSARNEKEQNSIDPEPPTVCPIQPREETLNRTWTMKLQTAVMWIFTALLLLLCAVEAQVTLCEITGGKCLPPTLCRGNWAYGCPNSFVCCPAVEMGGFK